MLSIEGLEVRHWRFICLSIPFGQEFTSNIEFRKEASEEYVRQLVSQSLEENGKGEWLGVARARLKDLEDGKTTDEPMK